MVFVSPLSVVTGIFIVASESTVATNGDKFILPFVNPMISNGP